MPILEFMFEGQSEPVKVEPWVYTVNQMDKEDQSKNGACIVMVASLQTDWNAVLLGDPFLRKYVTSFNYDNNTITFGKNKYSPVNPFQTNEIIAADDTFKVTPERIVILVLLVMLLACCCYTIHLKK